VEGGLAAAFACVTQRARDRGYIGRNVQLVAALPPGSPALSDRVFSNLAHPIITDEQNYPQEIEVDESQLRRAATILGARHQKVISRSGALSLAAALTYAQECPVGPGQPRETLVTLTTEALPE
jgi:hypothetical protein